MAAGIDTSKEVLGGIDDLNAKWQFKFRFFHEHGLPGVRRVNSGYEIAFDALPLRKRRVLQFDWCAFFFGVLYLLHLGMWRKAVVLAALSRATAADLMRRVGSARPDVARRYQHAVDDVGSWLADCLDVMTRE